MEQNALTVIVPIKSGEATALEQLLTEIGEDVEGNPHFRFRDTPSTHFARWAIVDRDPKGDARLLFISNYDGSFESYMRELVEAVGPGMEQVWSKCEGYSPGAAWDVARFTEFIRRYSVEYQVFYVALAGASVQTIVKSARLREMVDELLDRPDAEPWVRQLAALLPAARPGWSASPPRHRVAGLLEQLELLAAERLLELLEWLAGVRRGAVNPNLQVQASKDVLDIEGSKVVQTPVTLVSTIKKPQFYHRLLLRITLFIVDRVARASYGSLAGVSSIHFARWAILDGGRHLLFETNFDGSWERYLDDFVDNASVGLNAIWANCVNYPTGGAEDSTWFKKFFRDDHYPAQVFYSAYPFSTVNNIFTDLRLGAAVEQFLRQEEVERFLGGSYAMGSSRPPTDEMTHGTRSPVGTSEPPLRRARDR
jgi:hypothetical protein